MAEYISLRAYARRRGVSLGAVQKAIESRRVTAIREDGNRITGIDPLEADRQWAANTDAIESARNGKFLEPPAGPVVSGPAAAGGGQPGDKPTEQGDQGNFLLARIRGVELDNQLKDLDKLERMGELVPWAEIEAEFGEIFAQHRNAAFRIPGRLAQILAAETDPVRIDRLITDQLRAVFDESSRRLFEGAIADVAGEPRVAAESEAALS